MARSDGGAFDLQHPWFLGGVLLLGSVVLGVALQGPGPLFTAGRILATLFFTAALLVFAFGIRRRGSVTARRPLGTAALSVLAMWTLVVLLVPELVGTVSPTGDLVPVMTAVAWVDPYIRFALALITVVQVGRASIVPTPWQWAPAWVLAALTVPWLLGQLMVAGRSAETDPTALLLVSSADALVRVCGTVVLGVLAILLADRSRRSLPEPARSTTA